MPRLDYLDAMRLDAPAGGRARRPPRVSSSSTPSITGEIRANGRSSPRETSGSSPRLLEVWRGRAPLPWWAVLRYDPVFTNGRDDGTTNLDNVNPEIVILKRDARVVPRSLAASEPSAPLVVGGAAGGETALVALGFSGLTVILTYPLAFRLGSIGRGR